MFHMDPEAIFEADTGSIAGTAHYRIEWQDRSTVLYCLFHALTISGVLVLDRRRAVLAFGESQIAAAETAFLERVERNPSEF